MDLYETTEGVVVLVELAGVGEGDFEIVVDGKTLVVRGQRTEPRAASKRTYYQMEIFKGPFERSILLPVAVDANETTASYQNGILEIVLPRRQGERAYKVKVRTT